MRWLMEKIESGIGSLPKALHITPEESLQFLNDWG
jgi:hypothetical protein